MQRLKLALFFPFPFSNLLLHSVTQKNLISKQTNHKKLKNLQNEPWNKFQSRCFNQQSLNAPMYHSDRKASGLPKKASATIGVSQH